jgi:large subunit ribosomal protein L30
MTKLAIIRLAGQQGLTKDIKQTFKLLNLHKKYTCVVVNNTPNLLGMIKKLKDHITWGEIDKETLLLLLQKRGKLPGNKRLTEEYIKSKLNTTLESFANDIIDNKKQLKDLPGLKPFFRLTPPRGGFERKGTKKPFSIGGALGYRKDKINDLIKRMV